MSRQHSCRLQAEIQAQGRGSLGDQTETGLSETDINMLDSGNSLLHVDKETQTCLLKAAILSSSVLVLSVKRSCFQKERGIRRLQSIDKTKDKTADGDCSRVLPYNTISNVIGEGVNVISLGNLFLSK